MGLVLDANGTRDKPPQMISNIDGPVFDERIHAGLVAGV